MEKQEKIYNFFDQASPWQAGLKRLRALVSTTELQEDWKWGTPTYTLKGKNVIALGKFKHHFGIWFFQGSFLNDKEGILNHAQETTRGMRGLHFKETDQHPDEVVLTYILEAIQNSKDGKEIKVQRKTKAITIPVELKNAFVTTDALKNAFSKLTPGKQREYTEHIASAKQEATRIKRLHKCIPMILAGAGLNDKYKNC